MNSSLKCFEIFSCMKTHSYCAIGFPQKKYLTDLVLSSFLLRFISFVMMSHDVDKDKRSLDCFNSNATVISVTESRAREICICRLSYTNITTLEVHLVTDNYSYIETISEICDINPQEILLNDGCRNGVLSRKIESLRRIQPSLRIIYISRQYFDQDRGSEMLRKILVDKCDTDLTSKYTVLAGSYCLLRYIENCSGTKFASNTIRLHFNGGLSADRMIIDRRTALNLELINNMKTGLQKDSLFDVINKTKTTVGARLLRENILRPMTDLATIRTRLDFVELIVKNVSKLNEVQSYLVQLPDLEKLLSGVVTIAKNASIRTAKRMIDTVIFMKQTIKIVKLLLQCLSSLEGQTELCELLAVITTTLKTAKLDDISLEIDAIIADTSNYSKSQSEMRHQECFAIRSGYNGELDVSRKAYLQTVEDICEMAEKYSLEFKLSIKVAYNLSRGYYLNLPASAANALPALFIQAVQNARNISCTTEDIASLSDRANENICRALEITNNLLQDLISSIRKKIENLFNLSDAIATLDVIFGFADLARTPNEQYSRPLVTQSSLNDDLIVLIAARHPIISHLSKTGSFTNYVANDCFIGPSSNFHVITGANGSGKTVFIKQTALLVIMAQIGCYVPAKHATIAVRDRLLSRLGTSDDMEHNLSTFATEMRDVQYILSNLTNRSLIIIDELGRGTSNIDGLSLAFAIAEELIQNQAFTLFVSHYAQLTRLSDLYVNVRNFHLRTLVNSTAVEGIDRGFGEGSFDLNCGYGVILAEICGFPRSVVDMARYYQRILINMYPIRIAFTEAHSPWSVARDILQRLLILRNARINDDNIRIYLQNIRSRINGDVADRILQIVNQSNLSISYPTNEDDPIFDPNDSVTSLSHLKYKNVEIFASDLDYTVSRVESLQHVNHDDTGCYADNRGMEIMHDDIGKEAVDEKINVEDNLLINFMEEDSKDENESIQDEAECDLITNSPSQKRRRLAD